MKGKTLNTTVKPENESKHTPGPWDWKQTRGNNIYEHLVFKNGIFGYDIAALNGANAEETKANARLIAAAPELLERLQSFVDYLDSDLSEAESYLKERAEEAIAKATNTE